MAKSDRVRRGVWGIAVLGILAASAAIAADQARVPDDWLEGSPSDRAKRFDGLKVGEAPPALMVKEWKNSEAKSLRDLKGKVVMLDFWATWCGPCIASIDHNNDLYERYKGDGLALIGVCHSRGADTMGKTADEKGIKYPIAADVDGKTVEAYAVDSFPDYYFIDRAGKLRILDCKNGSVEDAIKLLLAEKAE